MLSYVVIRPKVLNIPKTFFCLGVYERMTAYHSVLLTYITNTLLTPNVPLTYIKVYQRIGKNLIRWGYVKAMRCSVTAVLVSEKAKPFYC